MATTSCLLLAPLPTVHTRRRMLLMPCSFKIWRMSFCLPFLSNHLVPQPSMAGTKLTSAPKANASLAARLKIVSVTVMACAPNAHSNATTRGRCRFIVANSFVNGFGKSAAKVRQIAVTA